MVDTDTILEKRQSRRSVLLWRSLFFILVLVSAVFTISYLFEIPLAAKKADHIARVEIKGFITDDKKRLDLINSLGESEHAKAVIFIIDSPGGSTVGGEGLYKSILELSNTKPTVAVIGTMGTSAAYMSAIATSHIFARRTSLTGSIGVLFQSAEVSQLLEKIGVSVFEVKSGELKAEPNFFSPPDAKIRSELFTIINTIYDWFVDIVAERRSLNPSAIRNLEGKVVSGAQALELKLIDHIGGEDEAIQWLKTEHKLSDNIQTIKYGAEQTISDFELTSDMSNFFTTQINIDEYKNTLRKLFYDIPVDGLQSVWQAPAKAESK